MNFKSEYKLGQEGKKQGIPMGSGLAELSSHINGIQKKKMYGVGAAAKTGKTTLVDYGFVIMPILYALLKGIPIEVIYLSYEIDRVTKEFDYCAFFLNHDYGIERVGLENGQLKKGKDYIIISSTYLMGSMQDDEGEFIRVKPNIEEKLIEVYLNRIVPLFGEYEENGIQIKKGVITFMDVKDNPTGIRNSILEHAKKNGRFITKKYGNSVRNIGYRENDPSKFTIVVTDHLRKLVAERGFNMKQNVDKFIEYTVELRNMLSYTFVHIIHLNRSLASLDRLKSFKDLIFPSSDDVKDTGNLAEECNYLLTMFNPNDERYNLDKHFGLKIKDKAGNDLYPNLRTIHLVEARNCEFPKHFRINMNGAFKRFDKFSI